MGKLFKYMGMYWKSVLAILAILFVQAYCDLSLPAYTSDIVNVGIQQGGVDETIPEAISVEEMNKVLLFVSEETEKEIVQDAYEKNGDLYEKEAYVLKESVLENEEEMEELSKIMGLPMMVTAGFESGSEETKEIEEQIMGQIPQGMLPEDATIFDVFAMMPPEQMTQMVEEIRTQMSDMPDMIVEQAGIGYVKTAYQDLGMDVDEIQLKYMFVTGGKMIALAFLGMIASVLVGFLASRVGAKAGRDLRGRVFRKVVGFSNNELDHFSTASLITRSTNDIQQIQMLMVMLLRMVLYAPILAIGGVYQVFQTNVSMSWIIGLAVVLIALVVLLLFVVAMPKFKIMQKLVDRLNLVTREILTGLPVIRAFSTEKHEEKRFDKANMDLTKTNLFVNRAMTFMMPVMMVIMNGISVLIVWVGANGINDGQMQVGDMMAFIQYTMQIIMGFLMLCMISVMLPRAAVAAERVDEVLSSKTIINDPKQPLLIPQKADGVLKFDHVSFRYPGASEDVLHDISFEAKPGETTAIIGSTGSGKSTLVNLIPRFYDVTEGSIFIDGTDIKTLTLESLRSQIGIVQQDVYLFCGSVKENIAYGKPGASMEEIIDAAKKANIHDFIQSLPDGYDTFVGERGTRLSGGQKQRISIARVFLKNPPILILDEATSALDNESERHIQKSLEELAKNRTTITIAHRLSTIQNADEIIVINCSGISERGTHQQLLEKNGLYAHYYQMQFEGLLEIEN